MPLQRITDGAEEYEMHDFNYKSGFVAFFLAGTENAHVCLSAENPPNPNKGLYEFCLGGAQNTVSFLRKNGKEPNLNDAETPGILISDTPLGEHPTRCGFILNFAHGNIELFQNDTTVLKFHDCEVVPIRYVGVKSVGAKAEWIIYDGELAKN